ncbi:MAG: hypothetical protein K2Q28_04850 [Hyphomicrobium sp.]|nr:hypothetical protein [Hyphomicrobium sp.]
MEWTNEDQQARLKDIPPVTSDPRTWPKHVRPLSLDDWGLGVDAKGSLYWQGKPVVVRRQLELRTYELALATIVTLATVVQAAIAAVQYLAS